MQDNEIVQSITTVKKQVTGSKKRHTSAAFTIITTKNASRADSTFFGAGVREI